MIPPRERRLRRARGLPLRSLPANAITALALCFGLSGIRFAISEEWPRAIIWIVIAAVLDGLDGRVARLLKGDSRFGAELDSLSDAIAFGVSPAIMIYLWSLQFYPAARLGVRAKPCSVLRAPARALQRADRCGGTAA